MTIDQELRYRLADLIQNRPNLEAADAILKNSAVLDEICEYRARQLNAAAEKPGNSTFGNVMTVFVRAQMYREAAASVALDHDERMQTCSVESPYPTTEPDSDKPD